MEDITAPKPIDWAFVESQRADLGQEVFDAIWAMMFEEIDAAIADLEALSVEASEIGATYHLIKGVALNAGLAEIAGLCDVSAPAQALREALSRAHGEAAHAQSQ